MAHVPGPSTSSRANNSSGFTPQNQTKRKKDRHEDDANGNENEVKIICTDKIAVQRSLECPVCLDICIPPIYQCNTGHHICKKCQKSNGGKCGSCSAPFRGTRNFFLENYFESCSFSCTFSSQGCSQILPGKDLKNHQENCDFRPLRCHWDCQTKRLIPFSKFLDHVATSNCSKIRACDDDGEFDFRCRLDEDDLDLDATSNWMPRQVQFSGHTFFAMNSSRNLTLGSWVTIFGNEEEANQFRVRILIEGKTDGAGSDEIVGNYSMSVSWEGPVLPMRSSRESVMNEKKCLFTSVHLLHMVCKNIEKAEDLDEESSSSSEDDEEEDLKPKTLGWFTVKCKLIKK